MAKEPNLNRSMILHAFAIIREEQQLTKDWVNPIKVFESLTFTQKWGRLSNGSRIIRSWNAFIRSSHYFNTKNFMGHGLLCIFKDPDPNLHPIADTFIIFAKNWKPKSRSNKPKPVKWKVGMGFHILATVKAVLDDGTLVLQLPDGQKIFYPKD